VILMMDLKERLISDEIKRLAPILGSERAERLNKAYLLGDEDVRKRIFELIDVIKAGMATDKDLNQALLIEPPTREQSDCGEILVGDVLYGKKKLYPFTLDKESLLTHVGIFGSSGYGKTNLACNMIKQLSDKGVPVLIMDFSKRNYRDLLATELKDRIRIYTIGRNVSPFRFNPLRPPEGIQLSQWMKEFSAIFDHSYWLLGGGRHIIMKTMDDVYAENPSPRMGDLKKQLMEYGKAGVGSRERNWISTAERPLESLCFKEVGEIFECDEGTRPSEFFEKGRITILELDGLSDNDKNFFIEITLQWLRDWLLVSGKREKLRGVIILEEAHHVLNREKANRLGSETVIDLVFREIRELGMGIVYMDQHPSMVSYPAIGNTSTQVYMNLGLDTKHSSDIHDASNTLGLDYREQGGYLRRLPVGQGFILCRMGNFKGPFLTGFGLFPIKKGLVSDTDLARHMGLEYKPEESMPGAGAKPKPGKLPLDEIDDNGWKVLRTIGEGRGAFTSEIYKRISMSGSVFNKVMEKLISLGLAGGVKAKAGKNRLFFYHLTDLGEAVFEKMFGKPKGSSRMDLDGIKEFVKLAGWTWKRETRELEAGQETIIEMGNGKTIMRINIEDRPDREKIRRGLAKSRYFLCATSEIRSIVLQEAAKYSRRGSGYTLFVALARKFQERGAFERIEFG
jgi:hypothetical protein